MDNFVLGSLTSEVQTSLSLTVTEDRQTPSWTTNTLGGAAISRNYDSSFLCKEQRGHKRRYESGQMMTLVYYRGKNSALFGTPN